MINISPMLHLIIILFDCIVGYDLIDIKDTMFSMYNTGNAEIEFKTDFNYNEFSLIDKKMPFINCNRKIMLNNRTDIVDMLILGNIDLAYKFLTNYDRTLSRITSITNIMRSVLKSEYLVKIMDTLPEQSFVDPDVLCKKARY